MVYLKGKDRKLVVVSNRLPFHKIKNRKKEFVWEKAAGGLITGMEPILLETNGVWLGWDGHPVEDVSKEKFKLI